MDPNSLQSARTRNHAIRRKSRSILLGRSYSSFVYLKFKIKNKNNQIFDYLSAGSNSQQDYRLV